MSVAIYLHAFRDGALAPANRDGILTALRAVMVMPIGDHRYCLRAADGGTAQLAMDGLRGGPPPDHGAFFLRGLTPGIIDLIYTMAGLGGMVITPIMDGPIFIVTDESWLPHLPTVERRVPPPVVCRSGRELGALLDGGFHRWQSDCGPALDKVDGE